MNDTVSAAMSDEIGANLPYLRRYARALTGSQERGDTYAVATLEAILADRSEMSNEHSSRVNLYRVFHKIWASSGAKVEDTSELGNLARQAHQHIAKLTAGTREALLLSTIEEFVPEDVAKIMAVPVSEAKDLIAIAIREMSQSMSGKILIIEDETLISMDIETIVTDMGHQTIGIARTETEAVALAAKERPDLILSDIQLADESFGDDAVNAILASAGDIPVIFITAFPERLLTGNGPEPAFLITKPYTEDQVRSAVSQAMFFSSTETLKA